MAKIAEPHTTSTTASGFSGQGPADASKRSGAQSASRARRRECHQLPDAGLETHRSPSLLRGLPDHLGFTHPSARRGAEAPISPYAGEKESLQFPLDQPIPVDLIKKIVRLRSAELGEGRREEEKGVTIGLDGRRRMPKISSRTSAPLPDFDSETAANFFKISSSISSPRRSRRSAGEPPGPNRSTPARRCADRAGAVTIPSIRLARRRRPGLDLLVVKSQVNLGGDSPGTASFRGPIRRRSYLGDSIRRNRRITKFLSKNRGYEASEDLKMRPSGRSAR